MGAGDDTVVYAVAGAGGSLNGGDGNDTLVVSGSSAIAGLPEVSGFETLRAVGAGTNTHNANTFKALETGTAAGTNTFTNVAAGVGLTVLAAATSTTVTLANATGTADVFDLTLKSAVGIDAGKITIAGVETININSVDTNTTSHNNDIELVADTATSIVVTGNTGLDFVAGTNSSATKVTNFDASAVEGAVTFTSTNNAFAQAVTIKGATGNFVNTLTGGAANDTIIGGAGADTLAGAGGVDTLTGGAGIDTFKIAVQNTTTVGIDKITDFVGGVDKISTGKAAATLTDLRANDFSASASVAAAATSAIVASASTIDHVVLFTYQSKVYAAVNKAADSAFTEGTDVIVDITGVTGTVTSADFIL